MGKGKTKSKRQQEKRKIIRSSYTGRVANGREIILVKEAEEYLKKQGYHIIKPSVTSLIMTTTISFIIIGGLIII